MQYLIDTAFVFAGALGGFMAASFLNVSKVDDLEAEVWSLTRQLHNLTGEREFDQKLTIEKPERPII